MKLIDADEAFRILSDYYHHRTEVQHDALREALDRVPEVVVNENEYIIREISYPDATIQKVIGELVRCKDCRYNYGNAEGREYNPNDIVCTYFETDGMDASDYCSYGERKTAESE